MRVTQHWTATALIALVSAGLVACGDKKTSPTSPTAGAAGATASTGGGASGPSDLVSGANPDGSTLKASAPSNLAPANRTRTENRTPVLQWTNSAGVYQQATFAYQLELYEVNTLLSTVDVPQGSGATTSFQVSAELKYDTIYRWRVRAKLGAAVGPWAATVDFITPVQQIILPPPGTGGGGGIGPRTPDPAPGTRLPLPNMSRVIVEVANQYPAALRNSCQEHGGTWEFMDAVVDTLRANYDTRWGYNCKRGNCNDPSLDVIAYHYGPGNDEFSKDVYIIDIIGGHCGASPVPVWNDVTAVTAQQGTTGGFTSRGRFGQGQLATGGGGTIIQLPPVAPGSWSPINGRTPDPPSGYRLPLPSNAQALVEQLAASAPDMRTQSCPRGIKYVNNPWQDHIIDGLRRIDSRWGYNAKPNRTANDNGGVPVVAAGDEITYHWGAGRDQGSTEVYSIDILASHCGTPSLTWRDFTGEEPAVWTGAGRF
jgi:hypothetical protein